MTETKRSRRIPLILIILLWVLVAVSAFATWKLKTQRDLALEQMKASEAAQKKAAEEIETEVLRKSYPVMQSRSVRIRKSGCFSPAIKMRSFT